MLKEAVQTGLARIGYTVVKTEPRFRPRYQLTTTNEIEELDRELATLPLGTEEYGIWTSPTAVRTYLGKERLNFYHKLVASAADFGVRFVDRSVLDVGTCSGYLLRIIERRYPGVKLSGTDYYDECVRLARALVPGANVFQASINDLKVSADTYDVVFCTEVIEHIVDTETQIPAMLDLLNPGGALIVTVPNGRYDSTPHLTTKDGESYIGHVNFWSEPSWEFYVNRVAGGRRAVFGKLAMNLEDDILFAIIFKD